MLISRLEKKIKSLEERALLFDKKVESLKNEKESLRDQVRRNASEFAAKIYLLEEARDDAQRKARHLEEQLQLERSQVTRRGAGRRNRKSEDDDS